MQVIHKAGTMKENGKYYPILRFYSSKISDAIYINEPQPTRAKARTIANRAVKNANKQK
jgi:hypothetical protein